MFRRWLAVLLLLFPGGLMAQFTFTTNSGAITITGYSGPGGAVTIPATTNGYPVTAIGNDAFEGKSSFTSVSIPFGVTSIGSSAFHSCRNLTNVSIPFGVTNIGSHAFAFCQGLTSVTLPSTLTNIADHAFFVCSSLTSVTIPSSIISIGDVAFDSCSSLTNVTIPQGVASIGWDAFGICTSLANIFIPNSVTNLGTSPFLFCSSLTAITVDPANLFYSSVDGVLFNKDQTILMQWPGGKTGSVAIPDSVTTIGESAFNSCNTLTNLTIPHGVTYIATYAFQSSTLTSVTIPSTVITIGFSAFNSCGNLTNIIIASGVTDISTGAFHNCVGLTSITLPDSVTNIAVDIFQFSTNLTAITVAGDNGFYSSVDGILFNKSQTVLIQCPEGKVGSVNLPGSLFFIGNNAFRSCKLVTEAIIPASVINIGNNAFAGCSSLVNAALPGSLTSIGGSAFVGCTSLTNATIPGNVTNIGFMAFSRCTALNAIVVDQQNRTYRSVEGILFDQHQTTLIQCPGAKLGNYTVPSSVASVGAGAFLGCNGMTGLYFEGNAPFIHPANVFTGANNITNYYLPGTTGWLPFLGGRPTALWRLPNPVILDHGSSFGVRSNQFGFVVSWVTNASVTVMACTNLAEPFWLPVRTNSLINGSFYFSDPQWKNYPARLYRLRSP